MAAFSSPTAHVVIFPFMCHSHAFPLIDLSKALSLQGVKVTIVTIPSYTKYIPPRIEDFPLISVSQIPFPSINGVPDGCENPTETPCLSSLMAFLNATRLLKQPFEQLLESMRTSSEDPDSDCRFPLCVIYDYLFGWIFNSCEKFGIPSLVFQVMGVFPSLINKALLSKTNFFGSFSVSRPFSEILPELPFDFTADDLPDIDIPADCDGNPFFEFMREAAQAEEQSWGIVFNSVLEIENDYVSTFESLYTSGVKAWFFGPSFLYGRNGRKFSKTNNLIQEEDEQSEWLNTRADDSVIYAAFGTQSVFTHAQLDEVALGLESSGCSFMFVVRSENWSPPDGFEERVKPRGIIVRKFVDQCGVLFHRATGGFLSHCGWNSVLESLTASVPILGLPHMGEQKINSKYVADGLGIGISMARDKNRETDLVSREIISERVKELMEGEKGKKAREKAKELGKMAREAVENGGSSNLNLKDLIHKLKQKQKQTAGVVAANSCPMATDVFP